MNIEILDFIKDCYNFKLGYIDIKVTYSEDKSEVFRNIAYFQKENKRWCMFPNVKRNDKWIPIYERTPPVKKEILDLTLKKLDDYFLSNG